MQILMLDLSWGLFLLVAAHICAYILVQVMAIAGDRI